MSRTIHELKEGEGQRPVLEGEGIYLRAVRLADVNDNYYRWMSSPEVTRYLESRFQLNSLERLREYVSAMSGDGDHLFLAIVLKDDERHIGNIKLGPINRMHSHAEIGVMIGEKDCWGRGYATEAIRVISDYAFRTLNLHKVTAGCYGLNQGSVRAFEKAGFKIEGVRPQHFCCDGEYTDHILLGMLNPTD